jgi:hypothetical protein
MFIIICGGVGWTVNDFFKESQKDKAEALQEENSALLEKNKAIETENKELKTKIPSDPSSQANRYTIAVGSTFPLYQNQVVVRVTDANYVLGEANIEITSTTTLKPQKYSLSKENPVITFTHGEKKGSITLVKVNDVPYEEDTVELAFTQLN